MWHGLRGASASTLRLAVAALHEVWAKCREVEQALGRDLDGLEGVIQDMAAGLDNPELMMPLQKFSEGQRIEIGWILDGAQQWVRRVGLAEKAGRPAGATERESKRESDRR